MAYTPDEIMNRLEAAIKGITTQTIVGDTVLEPYQFEKYVRVLQKKAEILSRYRLMVMQNPIVDIDRIAFSSRVMGVPPTEGEAKSTSDFVSPSFAQHQLISKRMQGVVSVTDQALRNNPERQKLMDSILTMMAERGGLDIEEQGINGDTGSSDAFLALNDGWIKLARRRVVEDSLAAKNYDDVSTPSIVTGAGETTAIAYYDDVPITGGTFEIYTTSTSGTKVADEDGDGVIDEVGGSGISGTIDYNSGKVVLAGLSASTNYYIKYTVVTFDRDASSGKLFPMNMFDRLITVIPKEYFRVPRDWDINVPWWVLDAYRDQLQSRGTDLGDRYMTDGNDNVVPYKNVNVRYVPNMPENQAWMTHPDNTIYGVFVKVYLEQEREAKAKRTDIIIDTETDYSYEEFEAVAKAIIY